MKKEYIMPNTIEVMLKGESVLNTGSITVDNSGGTVTPFDEDAEDAALGRRHRNVWDDDEEEEEFF